MSNLQSGANKAQMIELLNSIKIPIMGAGGGFAPIGTVNAYMGITAPQGWLVCNGQTVNIADYPELATHFASHFGSANFFGGDGTTTIAVPDLRGEFLRGSGTNSHANQGSGANVGAHQDGTEIPFMSIRGTTTAMIWSESTMLETKKEDSKLKQGTTVKNVKLTGVDGETGASTNAITTRPTNTSVLFVIKATVSGDANGEVYSTEETICGTWVDGKSLFVKVFTGLNAQIPTNGWNDTVVSISDLNIDTLVDCICLRNSGGSRSDAIYVPQEIGSDNGYINIYGNSRARTINTVIIRYTKTTD